MKNRRDVRTRLLCVVVAVVSLFGPATAALAACNAEGCWSMTVSRIKVSEDGRIWVLANPFADLDNLNPANGCVVQQIFAGQPSNALFIRSDDPQLEEKYAAVLTAYVTGRTLTFATVKEQSTGWCALGDLSLT